MRKIILAALSLASTAALAQTPAAQTAAPRPAEIPGKADPSLAPSGSYTLDSGHSQVLFTVNHLGFTMYTGQFTNPTGTLVLDTARPAASKVEITFPIDRVSTTVAALDGHLKSPDFFDVAKFPTATFVSTAIVAQGTNATITGNLTLKGVTKPVTLQARFVGAGKAPRGEKKTNVGFAATTTIKRSDFGITFALPGVSDEVQLVINAGFQAQ